MTESTETVVTENNSNAKVRSSFTMARGVMDVLKARAVKEDVSVSCLIEKAVAEFLSK